MAVNKKYQIIYADLSWKYNNERCQGTATSHYQTMENKDRGNSEPCFLAVKGKPKRINIELKINE